MPITRREWAFFASGWLLPLALLLSIFTATQSDNQTLGLSLVIALLSIVINIVFLTLLMTERWTKSMMPAMIGAHTLVVVSAAFLLDPAWVWLSLPSLAAITFYMNWLPALVLGFVIAVAGIGGHILTTSLAGTDEPLNIPLAVLSLLALPTAGPLIFFLSRDEARIENLQAAVMSRRRRAEEVTRFATEYMRVVYELTDVLSASKLDPRRVLRAAVTFSLEALERVGMEPPLFGAILLFAEATDGSPSILKVSEASMSVSPSDRSRSVTGTRGIIEQALSTSMLAVTHSPDSDPELKHFESFGGCQIVACLPLQSGTEFYGVMLIGSIETDVFSQMHTDMMQAVANQAAASLNNARLYGALLEQRDRLIEVEKVMRAQLASDLHDGPTQGVAAITMRLNYIRKLIEKKPERAAEEIYQVEDVARRTTMEIRHMLFELRPLALQRGLEPGLEQLAAKIEDTYGQRVQLQITPTIDQTFDTQTTQTLFSVAVETLNNIRKHAKADRVTIALFQQDDVVIFEVLDNGVGFDVEEAMEAARHREGHLGLLNLQERAKLLEGSLNIESEPGQGTRLQVIIPIDMIAHRREEEMRRERSIADEAEIKLLDSTPLPPDIDFENIEEPPAI